MRNLPKMLALSAITISVLSISDSASAKSADTAKKSTPSTSVTKKTDKKFVTVKAGDTLEKIAKKHKSTYVRIFNANKNLINPDQIDVGDKVRIPAKKEKLPNRMSQIVVAPIAAPTVAYQQQTYAATPAQTTTTKQYSQVPVNSSSYYVGNGMWCTDYVQSMRPDVPIYGNAGPSWIGAAQADGKDTGTTPRAGAVAVTDGHVAYVEKVNKNGSYVVSEMGWDFKAGNYNKRTVSSGTFGGFIY